MANRVFQNLRGRELLAPSNPELGLDGNPSKGEVQVRSAIRDSREALFKEPANLRNDLGEARESLKERR